MWTTELGIFTSRYLHDTAAWGQETLVASRPYAHAPALAVDTAGNAQAMWHLDGAAHVEGVRYDAAAGTWGPVRDFGSGVQPLIGMDGAGNVLAVWSDLGATTSTVSFSRYMAATGLWSPPQSRIRLPLPERARSASSRTAGRCCSGPRPGPR